MGLLSQAEADLAVTLEAPGDFGTAVTLTDPSGFSGNVQMYGMVADIEQMADPDTGVSVTARHASCVLRITSLTSSGFTWLPVSVPDAASKPWRVSFASIHDPAVIEYKVKESRPDRALGVVSLILEFYVAP